MNNTLSLFILLQNEKIIIFMKEQQNILQFGNKIRELRETRKLTQAELAEMVGFSTNFVGMIERGKRNTTVSNVFKFAEALGVEAYQLFIYNK